jgi:hypothetical protein
MYLLKTYLSIINRKKFLTSLFVREAVTINIVHFATEKGGRGLQFDFSEMFHIYNRKKRILFPINTRLRFSARCFIFIIEKRGGVYNLTSPRCFIFLIETKVLFPINTCHRFM